MNTEPNYDLDADARAAAYALRVVAHILKAVAGNRTGIGWTPTLMTDNAYVGVKEFDGALLVFIADKYGNPAEEIDRFPLSDPLAAAKCALGYCAWQEALAYSEEG
jgi:hypothetical protein